MHYKYILTFNGFFIKFYVHIAYYNIYIFVLTTKYFAPINRFQFLFKIKFQCYIIYIQCFSVGNTIYNTPI